MARISDEIRELIDDEDLYPRYIAELRRIADRIDRELVELPLSADRKIWTGREECFWIEARGGAWSRHSLRSLDLIDGSRWYVRDTGGLWYEAGAAWQEFHTFADRIRNLAKKEGEQ